jgi:hypothetical protein
VPEWDLLTSLAAARILQRRILSLAADGRTDQAWSEWRQYLEFVGRLDRPASLLGYAFSAIFEVSSHELFVTLSARAAVPETCLNSYPVDAAADRYAELVELELAYTAQVSLALELAASEGRQWFDWVRMDKHLKEWPREFVEPIDEFQTGALHLSDLQAMYHNSKKGLPRPAIGYITLFAWSLPARTRAEVTAARFRASLACELRRAESGGESLHAYVPDPTRYARVDGQKQADGSYLFTWDVADEVKRLHQDAYAADEELFQHIEPIKLFPLK